MSTYDELPFVKTTPNIEFTPYDTLYEIYRYGVITRHICCNGRLNETTWMRRMGDLSEKADILPPSSVRQRNESYKEKWYDDDKVIDKNGEFLWQPIAHPSQNPGELNMASFGTGDNSLMRTGLALALFSLEARHGISEYSADYARLTFKFLCDCEWNNSGFFLRKEAHGARKKYASTDEMLGLCVGVYFYHQYLKASGNEPEQLEKVVSLVTRIANNMNAHGYWILPYASDYINNQELRDAFLDPNGDPGDLDWTKQQGFAFAYGFRLFFEKIAGVKTNLHWDNGEYHGYFALTNRGKHAWKAIVDAVVATDPSWWDYVKTGLVGMITGVGAGVTVIGLALIDKNMTFDENEYFTNFCKVVKRMFSGDDQNRSSGDYQTRGFWGGIKDFFKNLVTKTQEMLIKLKQKLKDLWDKIRNPADHIDYWNWHMLGLTGILAIECGACDEARDAFGECMTALLEHEKGRCNTFFAALSGRFDPNNFEKKHYTEALNMVVQPRAKMSPTWFQYDLPMTRLNFLNLICDRSWPELFSKITDHVQQPQDIWMNELRDLQTYDFNPLGLWGGSRTWEVTFQSDHAAIESETNQAKLEKFSIPEIVGEILRQKRMIAAECCGIDFLFARMLAVHYGLLEAPRLNVDRHWPVLPFWGACPMYEAPVIPIGQKVCLKRITRLEMDMESSRFAERAANRWAIKNGFRAGLFNGEHDAALTFIEFVCIPFSCADSFQVPISELEMLHPNYFHHAVMRYAIDRGYAAGAWDFEIDNDTDKSILVNFFAIKKEVAELRGVLIADARALGEYSAGYNRWAINQGYLAGVSTMLSDGVTVQVICFKK